MAEGIYAEVGDGFARIQFIDPTRRGEALAKLIEIGGPGLIEVDSRSESRKVYIVPESIAQEAGLLEVAPEPVKRAARKAVAKPAAETTTE